LGEKARNKGKLGIFKTIGLESGNFYYSKDDALVFDHQIMAITGSPDLWMTIFPSL